MPAGSPPSRKFPFASTPAWATMEPPCTAITVVVTPAGDTWPAIIPWVGGSATSWTVPMSVVTPIWTATPSIV